MTGLILSHKNARTRHCQGYAETGLARSRVSFIWQYAR